MTSAPPSRPPGPVPLSGEHHLVHALLVVGTVVTVVWAGRFHCVSGPGIDGHRLVHKARWGFHDQWIDLSSINTWDVDDHRAAIDALVAEGLATVNSNGPPVEEEQPRSPSLRRWCYQSSTDVWCYDEAAECRAQRNYHLRTKTEPLPRSKCFRER